MTQEGKRDFVKYSFFKVAPEWRRLPAEERDRSKAEFAGVVEEFADRMSLASYSLVGTRGDADFLLWKVSPTLEAITELQAQLNRSSLGRYLSMPHSYLAMTRRSPYVAHHQHPGQEGANSLGLAGMPPAQGTASTLGLTASTTMRQLGRQFLFIYPFVKTHDWYQLPQEDRQRMMNQHFAIGHKYPDVKISTAYSFGLDDQEFVLGFETDDAGSFLDLVMDLRESEARPYTLRDTPIFTCRHKPLRECLEELG